MDGLAGVTSDKALEPPEPDSVPPVVPFTKEDTISLDTSSERKPEEDISMIVHIDESQDDLDADLETPKKQPLGSTAQDTEVTAGDHAKKEPETCKVESKLNDSKGGEKKTVETPGGPDSSETKTEKTTTSAEKKDNKKEESSSDAKKETRLVCMLNFCWLKEWVCTTNGGICRSVIKYSLPYLVLPVIHSFTETN